MSKALLDILDYLQQAHTPPKDLWQEFENTLWKKEKQTSFKSIIFLGVLAKNMLMFLHSGKLT